MKHYEVIFQPYGKRLNIESGTTILEAANTLGLDIASLCAGKGLCGKCKVKVEFSEKELPPLTKSEMNHLSQDEIKEDYRIACLTKIPGKMIISVPERSRIGKQRLQTEGRDIPVTLDQVTKKYLVTVPKASLHDIRSDEERLLQEIAKQFGLTDLSITFDASRQLPINVRKKDGEVTVVIWDTHTVVSVEPGDTSQRCYGLAVDIGTTKLAGFLIDLTSGKVVGTSARMNPQIPYGEDVISRINYSMQSKENLRELQRVVINGINDLIQQCCERTKIKPDEIYEASFVGNTCMHHLFLNLTAKQIALSPYVPAITRGKNIQADKINGLQISPYGNIYVAPTIGGFVGGDTVAGVMASDILRSDQMILCIDIGTNTEIALGNKHKVMTCSCASGPAFEGMHIQYGMRAATGAIEKVSIDSGTGEVTYRTIDDSPPVGLCGSGLIDILAELLKAGILTNKGKIVDSDNRENVRKGSSGVEVVIASKQDAGIDSDIVITESDIRELQLAKAAMHTGAAVMMMKMNITERDIDKLVLAGAFGNYIDPESARTIGMYPEVSLDKIQFVGNSAGTGARMMLVSKECREYAEKIAKDLQYFELAIDPNFTMEYTKSMFFPHMDLVRYPITKDLLERLGHQK